MSTRVMEQVDEWASRPFDGGYAELHTLADEGFSGVIRGGPAELYMTKGTVVGVLGGSLEDFEDAGGTAYEAPSPALPLLAVMQDQDEDARAEYYTEETGLDEVDSKLSDGGFTGYVELSENVLSGDYFVVYHQGRSMSVAFVGPENRVKTDEDARERATDEIGIYRVYPADIASIELPEPAPEPEPTSTPESGSTAGSASEPESEEPETATATAGQGGETAAEAKEASTETDAEAEEASTETDTAPTEETTGQTGTEPETVADGEEASAETATEPAETAAGTAEATPEASTGAVERPADGATEEPGPDAASREETAGSAQSGSAGSGRAGQPASRSPAGEPSTPDPDRGHLETRSIPSLDPGRTETDDRGHEEQGRDSADPLGGPAAGAAVQSGSRGQDPEGKSPTQHRDESGRPGERGEQAGESADSAEDTRGTGPDTARVEELEAELDDREAEIEHLEAELESATEEKGRLEAQLESATDERDRLEDELAAVRDERDDLAADVERLESELDRLENELGAATDREQRIGSREALEGTDIFVRYRSKGDPTLTDAHDSGILQEDVVENLYLDKHTQFDVDAVSVGGQTYGEFLEGCVEYQFVEWVATELLFEIRDTGHADALQTLYDALPEIDRAELSGTVEVVHTEDGEETRLTEQFDVVYRDRMGDPLLVANINDSREAATQSMMEELVTAAERVGRASDGLAGAFLVTESFFEPGALETANEATRSGLLSRSKYKSFVNLSRKRGYHLCLVEARSENFSLSVPEL